MDSSRNASQQEETSQDQIIIKLKKHFEDSVDFQKFNFYIQPLAETNFNVQGSINLLAEISKFITSEHQRSLLILGDSGNGKTLLGQYVVWQRWKEYQSDEIIPIFIHLPLIPQGSRAQKLLKSYLKSAGLNEQERYKLIEKNKLLLVLDGYDEIPELGNIYKQNHWEKLNIKMITTCRPEALLQRQTGNSYRELFIPKGIEAHNAQGLFLEFHLNKFNLEQIDEYLEQYLNSSQENNHEDWKIYKQHLNTIPGLLDLVATPFILSIVVRVLPRLAEKYQIQQLHEQRKLLRVDIYDYFVDDWLNFQVERFQEQGKLRSLKGDLKQYLKTYSQNLAYHALSQGRLEVVLKDQETLDPELLRPRDQKLIPQYLAEVSNFTAETMAHIRSGCLLKTGQNSFSFLHKSLVEYFASQDLFTGAHLSVELYFQQILNLSEINKSLSLNESLLMEEPAIIQMLADRVETDIHFKELLYKVINFSKGQPLIQIAAANAITILNVAGEWFSTKDFSNICIPNANLSGAICDQTDFSGADLTGVCFNNAWLQGANFSNAQLSNVDFAELPSIENSDKITSFCIDSDGQFLLIGDIRGKLSKWCLKSGKMEWKYEICPRRKVSKSRLVGRNSPIVQLTISPDRRKVAMSTIGDIVYIWDLVEKKKTCLILENQKMDKRNYILSIQFCPPDGKRLICSGKDGANQPYLQIWNLENNKCILPFEETEKLIFTTFPDGQKLLCYSKNTLLHYDLATLSFQFIAELKMECSKYDFSPNRKWLAGMNHNNRVNSQIELLDLTNYQNRKTFSFKGQSFAKPDFSPDENLLLVLSDRMLQLWHIDSGVFLYNLTMPFRSLKSFFKEIEMVPSFFCPTNPRHFFHSVDKIIYAWCLKTTINSLKKRTCQCQHYYFQEEKKYFHKFENQILLGHQGLEVKVQILGDYKGCLQVKKYEKFHSIEFKFMRKDVFESGFISSLSRNHRYLALALLNGPKKTDLDIIIGAEDLSKNSGQLQSDFDIRVFDLQKNQLLCTLSHFNQVKYMRFSQDSQWLIILANTVRVWDINSGKCLQKYGEYKDGDKAIALTSNKMFLAIADETRSLSIWDTSTNQSVSITAGLPIILKLLFIDDDNYLLGQTEKGGHLIPKVNQNGGKIILGLINSPGGPKFNAPQAILKGAYCLSNENKRLLCQRGAIGGPPKYGGKTPPNNSPLKCRDLTPAGQVAAKKGVCSAAGPKITITYDSWATPVVRKRPGGDSGHAPLVIGGLGQFDKGILGRMGPPTLDAKSGYAKIEGGCGYSLPPADIKDVFGGDITKGGGVYSKSWGARRGKVILLAQDVGGDKHKEIQYTLSGQNSVFTKSTSRDGHNCFTWAREKLYNLNDKNIKEDLPEKFTDFIAAKTSLYLPPSDQEGNTSSCTLF